MGDSGRRRSSMWDVDENQPFTSRGRQRDYSPSGGDNSLRPKAHSGWTSWEDKDDSIEKEKVIVETRERVEKNSYYKNMSPGFDGLRQQRWSHSPDNKLSQSRRYAGRGRSRSRSRDRSRGREKSRSRSRSWSRGRNKGRGWSRSRSRSRDRSRSRGSARDKTRSRSPFHDQGGRNSHGWGDRRSGSGRLSQICRDFSAGMCKRGNQCRFLHPDNADHRDDNYLESEQVGRVRHKPEPGRVSSYSYEKSRDKFSDAYDGEDEPLRNRSRGTVSCIDFMKGNCRFGGSCRFSHHSASQNDNYDRGFRNTSVDPDHERHQKKTGKILCKFFLAGNCQRDNCRFSHDSPTSNDLEDRSRGNSGGQSFGDLNKRRNGPIWDDTSKSANIRTESQWGEGGDADMDLSEEIPVGRRSDGRWGHDVDNESKVWGSPRHEEKGFNSDTYHTFYRGNDNRGVDICTAQPMVNENPFGEQKDRLISQNFQSQNVDKFSPSQSQNLSREASSHYLSTTHPMVSVNSDVSQYQSLGEQNSAKVLVSNPIYEVKESGNINGQSTIPDNRIAFAGHSSALHGTDQSQLMLSPISNALNVDLNRPVQHISSPLSLHIGNQSRQQEVTTSVMRESNYPFSAAVPSEQVASMTTPPSHLTMNLDYELKTQQHTVSDPSNSMSMPPYHNTAHPLATSYTLNINSVRSLDQYSSDNNVPEHVNSSNNDPRLGTLSYSNGQETRKPMDLLHSLSIINPESDKNKIDLTGGSGVVCHDSTKVNQLDISEKSDVNGNSRMADVGSKSAPKNISSDDVGGQGKEEGGNGNKDDKGTRLFKNALIEFVKEILKPTWKEGKMSREAHKNVVKKVVDKVTSSIQGEHVPRTQERIEQYLSSSKPKITKLAQAYVERSQKTES